MLYCTKCKTLFDEGSARCPGCGEKEDFREVCAQDFIYLHRADAQTAQILVNDFKAQGVHYELTPFAESQVSCLYDTAAAPTEKAIYVRCDDLGKAKACACALKEKMKAEEEFEEMPAKKRMAVKIISLIFFLLLVTGVVLLTDSAAEAVKNFFTGLFK